MQDKIPPYPSLRTIDLDKMGKLINFAFNTNLTSPIIQSKSPPHLLRDNKGGSSSPACDVTLCAFRKC